MMLPDPYELGNLKFGLLVTAIALIGGAIVAALSLLLIEAIK